MSALLIYFHTKALESLSVIFILAKMISKALSREAKEAFDIVLMVAQNIGLADNPPILKTQENRDLNTAATKKRRRRCNQSDLLPL